jgi:hypothetical protein
MTSALTALANANASFEVATPHVVTDPDTANVTPLYEVVSTQLFVKASPIKTMGYPGLEVAQIVFDGYALDPLDPRVVVGTRGTLVFGDMPPCQVEVTGLRTPYGSTGLLGSTLASVLGDRIELTAFTEDS